YYSLQLEHTFGRTWAKPIATNVLLAHIISWSTLAFELAFLPLAMVPSRVTRLIAVATAASLHLGILVLMNVGNFPVIMLSTLVLYLPAHWVDEFVSDVAARFRTRVRPRVVALADGVAHTAADALPPAIALPTEIRRLDRRIGGVALVA